jgi:hypothetical protein
VYWILQTAPLSSLMPIKVAGRLFFDSGEATEIGFTLHREHEGLGVLGTRNWPFISAATVRYLRRSQAQQRFRRSTVSPNLHIRRAAKALKYAKSSYGMTSSEVIRCSRWVCKPRGSRSNGR